MLTLARRVRGRPPKDKPSRVLSCSCSRSRRLSLLLTGLWVRALLAHLAGRRWTRKVRAADLATRLFYVSRLLFYFFAEFEGVVVGTVVTVLDPPSVICPGDFALKAPLGVPTTNPVINAVIPTPGTISATHKFCCMCGSPSPRVGRFCGQCGTPFQH